MRGWMESLPLMEVPGWVFCTHLTLYGIHPQNGEKGQGGTVRNHRAYAAVPPNGVKSLSHKQQRRTQSGVCFPYFPAKLPSHSLAESLCGVQWVSCSKYSLEPHGVLDLNAGLPWGQELHCAVLG